LKKKNREQADQLITLKRELEILKGGLPPNIVPFSKPSPSSRSTRANSGPARTLDGVETSPRSPRSPRNLPSLTPPLHMKSSSKQPFPATNSLSPRNAKYFKPPELSSPLNESVTKSLISKNDSILTEDDSETSTSSVSETDDIHKYKKYKKLYREARYKSKNLEREISALQAETNIPRKPSSSPQLGIRGLKLQLEPMEKPPALFTFPSPSSYTYCRECLKNNGAKTCTKFKSSGSVPWKCVECGHNNVTHTNYISPRDSQENIEDF